MWRLPTWRPQRGVPGTLTLSASNRARLQLDGTLLTTRRLRESVLNPKRPGFLPRILGVTDDGKTLLTLDRCDLAGQMDSSSIYTGRTRRDRYRPRVICIGGWFENGEPLAFDHLGIWLTSLHAWTAVSGFERDWSRRPRGKRRTTVYEPPRTRRATLPDGTRVELSFPLKETGDTTIFPREKTLGQDTRFELTFRGPQELQYIQDLVFSLRNLVTLGAAQSVNVQKLIGYRESADPDDFRFLREVELIYAHVENPDAEEASNHYEMLFTLHDFGGAFRKHVLRWWALTSDLRPVLTHYFSTLHISTQYLETDFLNYVQGVEGYHRLRLNRTTYSPIVFEEYSAMILAGLAGRPRRLARRALRWANEVSLEARIRDVVDHAGAAGVEIVSAGGTSPQEFARTVAGIRNDMAHALDKPPPSGRELFRLRHQLKALIEAILLIELGFSDERARQMLEDAWRFRRIRG
jgi:hypothetical protein